MSTQPALPPSATDLSVSLLGYGMALAMIALLRLAAPDIDALSATLLVMLAGATPPVIADLFVFRVYREKAAGLGSATRHKLDLRALAHKCFGLVVTFISFALLYFILPEYHGDLYNRYWQMVSLGLPFLLITTPFYFAWVMRRDGNQHDAYNEVALLALGKIKGRDWMEIGRHYRNWLVKAFFLPLMLTYASDSINGLVGFRFPVTYDATFMTYYDLADRIVMFADLLFASIGYVLTLRILNAHIRSSDPTFRGWVVALACYVPFWQSMLYAHFFAYDNGPNWTRWLQGHDVLLVAWGVSILSLMAIYSLATVCLGIRFSNLTYRGLVTSGPYRFTKHPAYVTKNISWWLVSIPFIHGDSWVSAARDCVLLSGVNLIYYLRARTEELHLSNYPEYVEYALAMNERSIFRPLVKFLPFLEYKVPKHLPRI